ncbi:MAG: FixH family protein [Caulobacterales bacterium]|nr:FixH family protein [Caulobacterales bacterium]
MTAKTQTAKQPAGFVIKGWHVAAMVVGFFAVVIAVDGLFLTLAYRTHPGQVAAKPYETGLLYNAEIKRFRDQQALGWRAATEARPGMLVVWMRDREGGPVTGLKPTALLQRPATEQGAMRLTLTETTPGQYEVRRDGLTGAWDVRIESDDGQGRDFVAERRLIWR